MRFQKPYLAFPVSWIPFENLNNAFGLNEMYIYEVLQVTAELVFFPSVVFFFTILFLINSLLIASLLV